MRSLQSFRDRGLSGAPRAALLLVVALALLLSGCVPVGNQPLEVKIAAPVQLQQQPPPIARGTTGFDDLSVSSVTTTGPVKAGTFLVLGAGSAVSLTNGSTLTPVASYQPIQSAGNVTVTLATTSMTTGSILRLVNTANTSIKISEGSTAQLPSTSVTLGQYDSLMLMFSGTYWVAMGASDN